jgi:hypothetical protein
MGSYGGYVTDSNANAPDTIWQVYARLDPRDTLNAHAMRGGWMQENTDYFAHGTGYMYGMKRNAATQRYEVVWVAEGVGFMPAVANGVIFTANPSGVRAFDITTGEKLTQIGLNAVLGPPGGGGEHESEFGPIIYNNTVYVWRGDGQGLQIGKLELGYKKKEDESFTRYVFTAAGAAEYTASAGDPFTATLYAQVANSEPTATLAGLAEAGTIEPERNYVFTAAGAAEFRTYGMPASAGDPFTAELYAIIAEFDATTTLAGLAEAGTIEPFGSGAGTPTGGNTATGGNATATS